MIDWNAKGLPQVLLSTEPMASQLDNLKNYNVHANDKKLHNSSMGYNYRNLNNNNIPKYPALDTDDPMIKNNAFKNQDYKHTYKMSQSKNHETKLNAYKDEWNASHKFNKNIKGVHEINKLTANDGVRQKKRKHKIIMMNNVKRINELAARQKRKDLTQSRMAAGNVKADMINVNNGVNEYEFMT